jgi:hypothetical protein
VLSPSEFDVRKTIGLSVEFMLYEIDGTGRHRPTTASIESWYAQGAGTFVSVTSEMDDGNKGEPFGPSPKA